MVHCSVRALDSVFAIDQFSYKVGERLVTHYDHTFEPVLLIVMCLFLSIRYSLFGVHEDGGSQFDDLLENTCKKLKYRKPS